MLIRHTFYYAASRSLSAALAFLTIVAYTRLLSPAEYGEYAIAMSTAGFIGMVFFQWIRLSLLRFFPEDGLGQQAVLGAIKGCFYLSTLLVVFFGLVAVLSFEKFSTGLVLAILFLACSQGWFDLNLQLSASSLKPALYGASSAVRHASALMIGIATFVLFNSVIGPVMASAVGALLATGPLLGKWKSVRVELPRTDRFWMMFTYGMPLSLTLLLDFGIRFSDRIVLSWILDNQAVGSYAAGYDLAMFSLTTVLMTVNVAAYPLVIRELNNGDVQEGLSKLRQQGHLLMVFGVFVTIFILMTSRNIALVVLGEGFSISAERCMPWIAIGGLLAGLKSFYFDLAFQLAKKTAYQVSVVSVCAVVSVCLNFLLIPQYAVAGAAYATVLTYALGLVMSAIGGIRHFRLPMPDKDWLRVSVAGMVMAAALYLPSRWTGLFSLVLQLGVGALAYGSVLVLLNFSGIRKRIVQLFPVK